MTFTMQNLYNQVYKKLKSGKINQAYADLPDVKSDFEAGMIGSGFIGADKFGDYYNDEFIMNKDLDKDSFT